MAHKEPGLWRYIKDWLRQRHYKDALYGTEMDLGYLICCIRYYLHFGTDEQKEMANSLLDEVGK